MQKREYSCELAGRTLTATFTDLADQANGSVLVRYGDTVVLATAVMSKNAKEGAGYFPLTVDYEEKFYASGRILGSRFIKREGRPSDEAVLAGRIIDRTIRPLFDRNFRHEVHVVITVLSIDEKNDPDVPSVVGASLALATSDIPWNGPVSAVRIGLDGDGNLTVNPAYAEREKNHLDLLVCGKDKEINMIEAEGKEIPEDRLSLAFDKAIVNLSIIENWQRQIIAKIGHPKINVPLKEKSSALAELFTEIVKPALPKAIFDGPGKGRISALKEKWLQAALERLGAFERQAADDLFEDEIDNLVHHEAIENGQRPDGRAFDEVRPLFAEVGSLTPIVHGTGIFYRGGTHIMTILTLSGPRDSQVIEGMEVRTKKYFMHHYNFPPFSVGETGRGGGTNRRSIGHGALAEKSLLAVIPSREIFPYTIRLVSEALASNGSTSMGSVCASSLALMDGGVPISRPVAGIAMGLMIKDGKYRLLTDIQGPEDHHGDMDFKVAGTELGVTGIQLDVKVKGISAAILKDALVAAQKARRQILEKMKEAIAEPRPHTLPSAPTIVNTKIPVDKIGSLIGPGGKNIQKLCLETNTEIEIEDSGIVFITGKKDGVESARKRVEEATRVFAVGERLSGPVSKVVDFGVFVKLGGDTEGLVHVSEIAPFRVSSPKDALSVGDEVPVVIKGIDERGKISLSIKEADLEFAKRKGFVPATGNDNSRSPDGHKNYRRNNY